MPLTCQLLCRELLKSCASTGGNSTKDSPVLSSAAEMIRLGLPGSVMSFFTRSS